ncbi:hypothetical protein OUO20_02390 [Arthrobacter sp. FX8]|uniref:hypothetical protein n=1 Tax=Arthrobacter sp. FX8 TaxID=2997335 RepID=UPI00227B641E|nr:hypothetical protein [Arthrobacter sp. FX8]WAJ33889.1 hypothetical protein OUO20_02390 [Arthrobacter sp. FX8]
MTNQYFPAGAVLTAVVLFWVVGTLGGLSLLNNNQPPLTTLTWMLFVYAAAVLTPSQACWPPSTWSAAGAATAPPHPMCTLNLLLPQRP